MSRFRNFLFQGKALEFKSGKDDAIASSKLITYLKNNNYDEKVVQVISEKIRVFVETFKTKNKNAVYINSNDLIIVEQSELANICNTFNQHLINVDMITINQDYLKFYVNGKFDKNYYLNYMCINSSVNTTIQFNTTQTTQTPPQTTTQTTPTQTQTQKQDALKALENFQKYNQDFLSFDGFYSARFLNTLIHQADFESAKNYIFNYMQLVNYDDIDNFKLKSNSIEFEKVIKAFLKLKTSKVINNRLEIIFGRAGAGKTYQAIQENPKSSVFLCSNDLSIKELLLEFDFENGNATFKNSALLDAIIQGETIIFDEIALLNNDCFKFLQGILDNKTSFTFNGNNYNVKNGFKIIGTMNLKFDNGDYYALPQPIVDRAYKLTEKTLTNDDLIEMIL